MTRRRTPDPVCSLSEITLIVEESDFARILYEAGSLELVFTPEPDRDSGLILPEDVVRMRVHRITGYSGPVNCEP